MVPTNTVGSAPAASAWLSCLSGKFDPFQKLFDTLVFGKTARCNTVSVEVSTTRSPPVSPKRRMSIAELLAQFMKLPLKLSPPQVWVVAALLRSKRL